MQEKEQHEKQNQENIEDIIVNDTNGNETTNKDSNDNDSSEKTPTEKGEVDEITVLRNQLAKQQEESKKNYDLYLRALAELDNFKKRAAREKEEYTKYASQSLIKRLLPVIDDLERALVQFSTSKEIEALGKGVEMVTRSLKEVLKSEGLEEVEALGKPFDPEFHQPLMVEESDEHPENTVIEVLQKGYTFHGRVIRPSLVKVSK